MTTKKRTTTRKGPKKAPSFVIAHTVIIVVCSLIAGATAIGAAMWTQSLGLTGMLAIAAAVFAGALAFLLDMVPVAFAPVWARAGWKLMIPGLVLLAGFMLVGGGLQLNSIMTFESAQKSEQIQQATGRYNTAQVKLDSVTMPERECLCPQTRKADAVQYDAQRKAPMLDKLTAEREIKALRETSLPLTAIGIAAMIYQIVAFLIRSMISAVTVRIQMRYNEEYAAELKAKDRARRARDKGKAAQPKQRGLRGNRQRLRLVAANDV